MGINFKVNVDIRSKHVGIMCSRNLVLWLVLLVSGKRHTCTMGLPVCKMISCSVHC